MGLGPVQFSHPLRVLVAVALCRAAATANRPDCPYCDDRGRCMPGMSSTFYPEADAVLAVLKAGGHLKGPTTLPGLGG